MKDKLLGKGYRSYHVDVSEAAGKMEKKLLGGQNRSCKEDEREAVRKWIQKLPCRCFRICREDEKKLPERVDTEAARKMEENLPGRNS